MKFEQYLYENNNKVLNILQKFCMPFLTELKNSPKDIPYRGNKRNIKDLKRVLTRKDRKPLNMPILLHNIFDEMFLNKFGWKARSEGVFTTLDIEIANDYGNPYLFFPIGKYSYIWNPKLDDLINIKDEDEIELFGELFYLDDVFRDNDFNEYFIRTIKNILFLDYDDINFDNIYKKIKPDVIKFCNNYFKDYTNKNFHKSTDHEIMFKCDSYYLVNQDLKNVIINMIKEL